MGREARRLLPGASRLVPGLKSEVHTGQHGAGDLSLNTSAGRSQCSCGRLHSVIILLRKLTVVLRPADGLC